MKLGGRYVGGVVKGSEEEICSKCIVYITCINDQKWNKNEI